MKPRDITKSKRHHVSAARTICEVHRQMYDLLILDPTNPKIIELLDEAFVLGMSLVKKLVEYKCNLPNWEKNLDEEEVCRIRKLRINLEKKNGESLRCQE